VVDFVCREGLTELMSARDTFRVGEPTTERPAASRTALPDARLASQPERLLALQRTVGNAVAAQLLKAVPGGPTRVLARDPEAERVKKLNKDYDDAVARGDWKAAAEYLNGFNRADILTRLAKRSVDEVAKLHQGALDNPKVGAKAQVALLTPELLTSYARKFRSAADLILSSPEAMTLVQEADAAKVKFGGYAEEGPGKNAWPYTIGDTVYTPKAHTDKVIAMSDFLFELNNAIRKPQVVAVGKAAAAGTLTAKEFARKLVEVEVEGMLRLGKVWFETKKTMGGGKELDKYDAPFYLTEFTDVDKATKTKDQIVADVLGRKYTEGKRAGKTVEQNYMDQFNTLYGKK
jgi:hypothetical protein